MEDSPLCYRARDRRLAQCQHGAPFPPSAQQKPQRATSPQLAQPHVPIAEGSGSRKSWRASRCRGAGVTISGCLPPGPRVSTGPRPPCRVRHQDVRPGLQLQRRHQQQVRHVPAGRQEDGREDGLSQDRGTATALRPAQPSGGTSPPAQLLRTGDGEGRALPLLVHAGDEGIKRTAPTTAIAERHQAGWRIHPSATAPGTGGSHSASTGHPSHPPPSRNHSERRLPSWPSPTSPSPRDPDPGAGGASCSVVCGEQGLAGLEGARSRALLGSRVLPAGDGGGVLPLERAVCPGARKQSRGPGSGADPGLLELPAFSHGPGLFSCKEVGFQRLFGFL
nr:PREDICTED: uncharacterized protein LOC106482535 [Apteryx mantelli mantelli]